VTTYLVTGGAGFIGSNLVEALLKRGEQVRLFDNFSSGKRENIAPFVDRAEVIEGDLTDRDSLKTALRGVDIVFHQAAIPSVPRSVKDPLESNESNVTGTLNLLVAARDAGVKRLIYASSSSVYGEQAPEEAKVESMTPQPISPYGVAKLTAELYCQVFYKVYGLETVSLRYFNVFGPRQDPASDYAAVIPRFITAFLRGEAPIIYGDGEQTRDFTYVGNVVAGNLAAAHCPAEGVAGEVFNLALGGQTSLNELGDILQELIGAQLAPRYADPRPGDIKHSRAGIEKIQRAMGYAPEISVGEGLEKTVAWYRQHISTP
jgi:UDP-glucose 4-epimerase